MVGGKIIDYYKTEKTHKDDDVYRFLVKDTTYTDTCCVEAAIPKSVINEIVTGQVIWWQDPNVYINVFGCEDVPFYKYGYSGGDAKSYYKAKMEHQRVVL